jgi:hypothetical protein
MVVQLGLFFILMMEQFPATVRKLMIFLPLAEMLQFKLDFIMKEPGITGGQLMILSFLVQVFRVLLQLV